MPELAEVHYFSRQWRVGLGQKVVRVHLHPGKRVFRGLSTRALARSLQGQTLRSLQTHGKQMLFRFGSDFWLGIHLGMSGRLSAQPAGYRPEKHDHLVLHTRNRALVFQDPRLFGRIRLARDRQPPAWWSSLPPGVFSHGFSVPHLLSLFQRRAQTQLKPLLLLQDFFPGIGNWMADEILWQARLDPRTRAGSLSKKQISTLHPIIRRVSRKAMQTIGKNWSDPPRNWLFLYRWQDGGSCPRCRRKLVRQPVGGRTTCWCPSCRKPALPRRSPRS